MPVTTSLLVAGSLLFLLGVLLLQRGLWPPRRGNTPHCGRCGCNLTGLAGEVCPECGGRLDEAGIVRGQRQRRVGLAATGAALGLLGLMAVGSVSFGVVQRIDWYPHAPAWWLVAQVAPPGTHRAQAAWAELMRRDARRELSAAGRAPLIHACLQAQAAEREGPLLDKQLDYLGLCYGRGQLSNAQSDWFFSKMAKLELKVRPRIRQGDPLTWNIDTKTRMPDGFMMVLKGGLRHGSGIVNDAPKEGSVEIRVQKGGHSLQSSGLEHRCVGLGRQKISLNTLAEVRAQVRKADGTTQPGTLYHSEPMTLTAELEVVPVAGSR